MKHNFYPVIHIKTIHHAISSAVVAHSNGADGVFLINMGDTTPEILMRSYLEVWNYFKPNHSFRLGINFLHDLSEIPLFLLGKGAMVWSDTMEGYSLEVRDSQEFYGPFAFKYQQQPEDFEEELYQLEMKVDVITTSGNGTGKPPSLEKIKKIYNNSKKPVAIASGISAENVRQFKPYVRDFLVGTSIGYHNLIPEKVRELADLIHE